MLTHLRIYTSSEDYEVRVLENDATERHTATETIYTPASYTVEVANMHTHDLTSKNFRSHEAAIRYAIRQTNKIAKQLIY